MGVKDPQIVLTPEGREELEKELHYLQTEKREEIGERIRIAREFGDISENSEFDDAKNEQAQLENRIAEIETVLATAVVSDAPKRNSKVSIGSIVTLADANGKERKFKLVGSAESDPLNNELAKVSNESAVGVAVVNKKKNDVVKVSTPSGRVVEYTIVKIER
jgi:transcription elongation factor GreA